MTLLSSESISTGLKAKLAGAPVDVTEFLLRAPGLSTSDIENLARELRTNFTDSFRTALQRYALDPLTIGGVTIGSKGGFEDFVLEMNTDPVVTWWGEGFRPRDLVLIGTSDGFAIIANMADGGIFAFHHGDNPESRVLVATDLDLFVRGLGTASLKKGDDDISKLASAIANAVGASSDQFWLEFVSGRT
jgi:hypothetical protein